jgi:hypothetical protein
MQNVCVVVWIPIFGYSLFLSKKKKGTIGKERKGGQQAKLVAFQILSGRNLVLFESFHSEAHTGKVALGSPMWAKYDIILYGTQQQNKNAEKAKKKRTTALPLLRAGGIDSYIKQLFRLVFKAWEA